jgi:formiminoglutamate deiminase
MTALWFEQAHTPAGWAQDVRVTIRAGVIETVESDRPAEPGDERAGVGLPGLCNVHSHAFQRAMAGLVERRGPEGDDFWTWRELMYRFLAVMGPEEIEAVAAQVYAEMLQAGFTRVGEFHYLHHDPAGRPYADPATTAHAVISAAETTGIGMTLLPVYYAQGGVGGAPPKPGQKRFICDPDLFARVLEGSERGLKRLPDGRIGVAPHSLRAITPEHLRLVTSLRPDAPVHIHASEQVKEVEDWLAWSGRRPVAWLLDEMGVDQRWCLIHATHLDAAETSGLAKSGAVAGLCPITEANLGDGVFPAPEYLAAGGRFGVGSDSDVLIDAAQELRSLEYAQRLTRRKRNLLSSAQESSTGGRLWRAALAGGGQALAAPGGLEPGASADIVALDADHPVLFGRKGDEVLDSWIFAGGPACVDRVWRRGVKVVEGGRHVAADAIAARYRRAVSVLSNS